MGQCSHVMVHCPTWSTATFGTVRISYVNHTGGAVCSYVQECTCVWAVLHVCTCGRSILTGIMFHKTTRLVYTHNVMYHSTTHCSSQAEVKSTLVHKVPNHWEATTPNCIVKACPTFLIHLKLPVSKKGQQVLDTLKGSATGSKVKGSD